MFAAELSGVDLTDPTKDETLVISDKDYDLKVAARMDKWLSKFVILTLKIRIQKSFQNIAELIMDLIRIKKIT